MISVVVSESENGKYAIIFSVHSLEMEWTVSAFYFTKITFNSLSDESISPPL